MALTATFYSFSKRQNSTKVPTGIVGTSFNITLKQPTSLNSPVFLLNTDTFAFNYCQFNGAYYFVTDTVSVRNDIWEVHCTKDVLATYRAQILASSAYVLYDTSANTEIVDSRLAIEYSASVDSNQTEIPQLDGDGVYSLAVVGTNSTDNWIISDPTFLTNILDVDIKNILNIDIPQTQPTLIEQIKASTDWLKNVFTQLLSSGKAPDCVRSCMWLPWNISGDSQTSEICLGDYASGVYGSRVENNTVLFTYNINIPWQVTGWRRLSPYTQVYLYLPFIGYLNIPTAGITQYNTITVEYSISKRTGELAVIVSVDPLHIIGVYHGNSGTPVAVGQSNIMPSSMGSGIVQTAVGAAGVIAGIASGGIATGAAGLLGLMSGMSNMMVGVPSCVGTSAGGADAGLPRYIECITVFHDTNITPDSVAATIGTPTFQQKLLSSVSGYVQTHEFSLQAAAPDQDLQRVNTYLNGGAFIE